ncbi:MAG TPA: glycosyltransferase family 39 protein [Anaerolineae bacterium]|nr:glycosyltransferase family 39 protein [Anaerolineae bacterium]
MFDLLKTCRHLVVSVTPLIIIVAIGVTLRLINLGGRPLWYDEAFSILYARLPYATMLEGTLAQSQGAAADVHPPFFYLSLQHWMNVFGNSVAAARLLSLAYGVGTILLAYGLMRELFDRRVGLIAAAFVALSPFQIAYSQEARMYAQLGFWTIASLWAFVRGARTNRWKAWVAFGVCGAAALYSHNLAFAFYAAIGLFVVARVLDGLARRTLRASLLTGTIIGALIMGALFSPWLVQLPAQFGKIAQSYWITPPTMVTFVQTLMVFGLWTDNQAAAPRLAVAILGGSLLILALILHELVHRRRELDTRVGLIVTMFVVPILVLAAVSYAVKPVYIIRGLLPSQISFLLLAAWAASRLPRAVKIGAGVLLGAIWIAVLAAHYAYAGFPRAPWGDVATYLRANTMAGDAIVHDNKLTFFPMRIADATLDQVYLPDVAGIGSDTLALATQRALGLPATSVENAIADRDRVWLILFARTRDDYRAAGFEDDPNWTAIDAQFDAVAKQSFADVDVYLFGR